MDFPQAGDEGAFVTPSESDAILGEPKAEFRPGTANLFAGAILAVLALGATLFGLFWAIREIVRSGGKLPIYHERDISWVVMAICFLLCAAGILVTFFFVKLVLYYRSLKFQFSAGGFCRVAGEKVDRFDWDDVVSITETQLHERAPIVKGPASVLVPRRTSHLYAVMRADGETCHFNGDSVRELKKVAEILRTEASARAIPWEIVEQYA